MHIELYLAFVVASAVLIIVPGPNVILIVAHSLSHGARHALLTVAGTNICQMIQLAITCIGMTSLLLFLSQWFEVLRWAGVAYLIYLGVTELRARPDPPASNGGNAKTGRAKTGRACFWQGFIVSATNPKTLLFYAAFFPQFIDPALPPVPQMVTLSVTFVVIALIFDGSYALLAGRARVWLADARRARIRSRITGTILIGAGLGLALARKG